MPATSAHPTITRWNSSACPSQSWRRISSRTGNVLFCSLDKGWALQLGNVIMAGQDHVARVISGQAWEDFCDGLKEAGQQILRPEAPATELDRAEGWRYLTRLLRLGLESKLEFADTDFPGVYALSHHTAKIGADNPDNIYFNVTIDGTKEYRLTGKRGTVPYFSWGTKANRYTTDGTMASTG